MLIPEMTTKDLRPIIHGALTSWWMTAPRKSDGTLLIDGTEVIDATEHVLSALVENQLARKQ